MRRQLRIHIAEQGDDDGLQARGDEPLDAEPAGVQHGPADDPPQHVPPTLVGRLDAVAGEERHRPAVIGQHAHRLGGGLARAVPRARPGLDLGDHVGERVGFIHGVDALGQRGDALEARAGVDARRRQRLEPAPFEHVVLQEDKVPVLEEPVALAAGRAVRAAAAVLGPTVVVQLRARAARTGRPRLPEVVAAEADDSLAGHAGVGRPQGDRLLVRRHPLVAAVDADPDAVAVEREAVLAYGQVPGALDGVLLEVLAEREVAQHLEEGEMAGGLADLVDVDGAEALLHAGGAAGRRGVDAEEVALERLHARGRDQDRGVPVGWDQRAAREQRVAALGEVVEEPASQLVRSHRGILSAARPATGCHARRDAARQLFEATSHERPGRTAERCCDHGHGNVTAFPSTAKR